MSELFIFFFDPVAPWAEAPFVRLIVDHCLATIPFRRAVGIPLRFPPFGHVCSFFPSRLSAAAREDEINPKKVSFHFAPTQVAAISKPCLFTPNGELKPPMSLYEQRAELLAIQLRSVSKKETEADVSAERPSPLFSDTG